MIKTIHSDEYKTLRNWLVDMRKEKKMTQRDLATKLEIQHSWVGKIETGERRIDIIEYCRICNALQIDPHIGLGMCFKLMVEPSK